MSSSSGLAKATSDRQGNKALSANHCFPERGGPSSSSNVKMHDDPRSLPCLTVPAGAHQLLSP